MHVNAATSSNLENMSNGAYLIDEPSGLVNFNKGKMPDGQQQYNDYEAMMDRMDELINKGVSKNEAAKLVFGSKGMGDTDPNAQYIQMLNQMMQNSAYNPAAYASNNQQPQMSQEQMAMLMQMMGAQG
jgi:cobalamin biosynthesis Co2+ chelatase CbiK